MANIDVMSIYIDAETATIREWLEAAISITGQPYSFFEWQIRSTVSAGIDFSYVLRTAASNSCIFRTVVAGPTLADDGAAAVTFGSWTLNNTTWHSLSASIVGIAERYAWFNGALTTNTGVAGAPTPTATLAQLGWSHSATSGSNGGLAHHAEAAIWTTRLTHFENQLLAHGVRPSFIRPDALHAYVPLVDNITPEVGPIWHMYRDPSNNGSKNSASPLMVPSMHPTMYDLAEAKYPIQQTDFNANSVDVTITDYRATRLLSNTANVGHTKIQWELDMGGDPFYFTTDANGIQGESANVLESGLDYIDIWLPPHEVFALRTRYYYSGGWTDWFDIGQFTALGYINSYDKYQILNRATITSPS